MVREARAGRPRVSSRETLAEAACELFLEKGYEATSVADITRRAGVSRSSFFNYFSSKGDVLWSGLDERLEVAVRRLDAEPAERGIAAIPALIEEALGDLVPDALALAYTNAKAMGLESDLRREAAVRQADLAQAVAGFAARTGLARMSGEILGAAWAAAVLSAIRAWAERGAGQASIRDLFHEASLSVPMPTTTTAAAAGVSAGARAPGVRQLRMVVRAEDFEETLRLYRDVLGMPELAAYEGEGDVRVVILDGGAATLEIANPAQVELIDRVETDGGRSDRIRLALEVDDTVAAADALAAAGAEVEAGARVTPWQSLNARLRTAGDIQLTLFQEGVEGFQGGVEG